MCLNDRHAVLERGIEKLDQLIEEKHRMDSVGGQMTKTTTTPKDFKD